MKGNFLLVFTPCSGHRVLSWGAIAYRALRPSEKYTSGEGYNSQLEWNFLRSILKVAELMKVEGFLCVAANFVY